jgi:hypothetical protein
LIALLPAPLATFYAILRLLPAPLATCSACYLLRLLSVLPFFELGKSLAEPLHLNLDGLRFFLVNILFLHIAIALVSLLFFLSTFFIQRHNLLAKMSSAVVLIVFIFILEKSTL